MSESFHLVTLALLHLHLMPVQKTLPLHLTVQLHLVVHHPCHLWNLGLKLKKSLLLRIKKVVAFLYFVTYSIAIEYCTIGLPELPTPTESNATPLASATCLQHRSYKLVGDNIDKNVKARYMRIEGSRNQSLHYFHSFAVLDRINFSHLPDVFLHTCLNSPKQLALAMLPSKDDDKVLTLLFETHVSRILCTHIPFFKLSFEDIVEWHIHHRYYDEMSAKSEVVCAC